MRNVMEEGVSEGVSPMFVIWYKFFILRQPSLCWQWKGLIFRWFILITEKAKNKNYVLLKPSSLQMMFIKITIWKSLEHVNFFRLSCVIFRSLNTKRKKCPTYNTYTLPTHLVLIKVALCSANLQPNRDLRLQAVYHKFVLLVTWGHKWQSTAMVVNLEKLYLLNRTCISCELQILTYV